MLTYRIMCLETETQTHCPVSWAPAALSTRDLKWKQRVVSSQTRAPHWSWALKRKLPVFMRKAGPRWCGSEWRLKVLSWKEDYKLAEMYGLTETRESQKTAHLSSNSLDCRARELWDNSVYIRKFHFTELHVILFWFVRMNSLSGQKSHERQPTGHMAPLASFVHSRRSSRAALGTAMPRLSVQELCKRWQRCQITHAEMRKEA